MRTICGRQRFYVFTEGSGSRRYLDQRVIHRHKYKIKMGRFSQGRLEPARSIVDSCLEINTVFIAKKGNKKCSLAQYVTVCSIFMQIPAVI